MFTNAAEARNLPTAKAVVEEFRKDGFEPEGYTLYTYAAIQVWRRRWPRPVPPIREGCGCDPRLHLDTVIGKLAFDAKGDLSRPTYVWYIFKDGKYADEVISGETVG